MKTIHFGIALESILDHIAPDLIVTDDVRQSDPDTAAYLDDLRERSRAVQQVISSDYKYFDCLIPIPEEEGS